LQGRDDRSIPLNTGRFDAFAIRTCELFCRIGRALRQVSRYARYNVARHGVAQDRQACRPATSADRSPRGWPEVGMRLHRSRASSPSRSRHALPGQSTWRSANEAVPSSWQPMGGGWTGMAPDGSSAGSPGRPEPQGKSGHIRSGMHLSPRRRMRGCRCATCRKRPLTLTRVPP
jgi:hypothetical protein